MRTHKISVRVRYEETDRMGVVYYANYFVWFEIARTEFFRDTGLSYRDLEEKKEIRLMVADAKCSYRSPATYDDLLVVETRLAKLKNTSLAFYYQISNESVLIATGETTHVFTDKKGKPIRIPQGVRNSLTASV